MLQAVEPLVRMTWEPAIMVTKVRRSEVSNAAGQKKIPTALQGTGKGEREEGRQLTGGRDLEYVVTCARQVHGTLEDEGAVEVVHAGSEGQPGDVGKPGALVGRGERLGLRVRRAEVGVRVDGGRGARADVLVSVDDSGRESAWDCGIFGQL